MSSNRVQRSLSADDGNFECDPLVPTMEQQELPSPLLDVEEQLIEEDEYRPRELPLPPDVLPPATRGNYKRFSLSSVLSERQARGSLCDPLLSGGETGKLGVNLGNTRSVAVPAVLAGKTKSRFDPRKFKYAEVGPDSYDIKFSVTRDDRLPVEQACDLLEAIRVRFGVKRGAVSDKVIASFDAALWFCHTVNGASRLNPGRSKFGVPGHTETFDYLDALDVLGTSARRFFRTYADDIADVNRKVLSDYDPYDNASVEKWSWLMEVATGRGLVRYPYLAHDSADACLHLTLSERAALAASKVSVLSKVTNAADYVQSNARMKVDDAL